MDFQDQDKQQEQGKNPFNANVLKGGQVDPRSKLYQRSIAGREKLDEFLQREWDQGVDEADLFSKAVEELTSRRKGYVGAYLDSNNPGRRYQKNEAMAIVDQVMSDLGIGDHPGARLTRPKDGEGKEERKTSNQMRGAFGPGRPEGEAPRKAMSVGQQRKQGKRSSTGQALENSRRPSQEEERQKRAEGKQDYYYTGTNVQREFMDIMKDGTRKIQERVDTGQITAEQAVKEMSKLRDQALTQAGKESNEVRRDKGDLTPKEQEQADKKKQRQDEMRQRIAEQKGLRDQEAAAGPEPEEASLTAEQIGEILDKQLGFIASLNRIRRAKEEKTFTPETINQAINQLSDYLAPEEEDPEKNKQIRLLVSDFISKQYPQLERSGWRPEQPAAAPEPKAAAAGTKEPAAAPTPRDKQTQATDDEVMRRAMLGGGKKPSPAPAASGDKEPDPREQEGPAPRGIPESAAAGTKEPVAAPEPAAPAAGPSEEEAPKPAQRKRTREETQEIQKRGSKELAKTQETNRKLEAMVQRMANSSSVKSEEMRNWINNDLDRLLKSFTPAEKTEDPWEQDGPEATGIPGPAAQAPASQKALAGQPGPKGLLPPGPNRATRRAQGQRGPGSRKGKTQSTSGGGFGGARTAAQKAPEVMKAGKAAPTLEDFKTYLYNTQGELFGKKGFETGGSSNPMEDQGPDPYAKYRGEPTEPRPGAQEGGREPATAGRGQEGQGSLMKSGTEFTKKPEARGDFKKGQKPKPPKTGQKPPATETAPPGKSRRTKAEGDEIRRRGQEALEQIQGEARRGREVQSRMANSPAATGEAPRTGREADITRRGEEALRGEVYGNIKDRPGMTNREANRILREGGYTQPRRGLDAAARAVTEGMDRHDAAVNKLPKRVRKSVPKFNSAEYQEFAQSIRSMMR
jgi:hypothetical protein